MNVAEREQELLAVVREYQDGECARVLESALKEGDRLIREGWNEARRRLRRVVSEERERARNQLRSAEAELSTRKRMHDQRSSLALLTEAWGDLRTELVHQWSDPEGRRRWVRRVMAEAKASLPPGPKTLTHPSGWPQTELMEAALALAGEDGDQPPTFVEDPRLEAGLVVVSGHARLDASLAGLLADRPAVEAQLLALLDRRPTR